MRIALDTNVVAYAEGVDGAERRSITLALLRDLPPGSVVIPAQVLGELFNVLVRKAGRSRAKARNALLGGRDAFPVVETSPDVMVKAADLATDHHLGIWDAVILSAASLAGCQLLLSEDLHDSFVWGGVTVANPYSAKRNAVLEVLLRP